MTVDPRSPSSTRRSTRSRRRAGTRSVLVQLLRNPQGAICLVVPRARRPGCAALAPWLAPWEPQRHRSAGDQRAAAHPRPPAGRRQRRAGHPVPAHLGLAADGHRRAHRRSWSRSLLGVTAGLVAGFYRGRFEAVASFVSDVIMSLPGIVLLIALYALTGPNILAAMAVFGVHHRAELLPPGAVGRARRAQRAVRRCGPGGRAVRPAHRRPARAVGRPRPGDHPELVRDGRRHRHRGRRLLPRARRSRRHVLGHRAADARSTHLQQRLGRPLAGAGHQPDHPGADPARQRPERRAAVLGAQQGPLTPPTPRRRSTARPRNPSPEVAPHRPGSGGARTSPAVRPRPAHRLPDARRWRHRSRARGRPRRAAGRDPRSGRGVRLRASPRSPSPPSASCRARRSSSAGSVLLDGEDLLADEQRDAGPRGAAGSPTSRRSRCPTSTRPSPSASS